MPVQVMRQRAQQAGTLKTTPQQTVTTQGSTVIIQPANPDVVYVPAYDPWLVYGYPVLPWPGWYPYPGIWYDGPYLSFGIGFGIGFFGGFGWGWPYWGFDWHHRYPILTTTGTTPGAPRFTTGTITTEEEARAADLQRAPTQAPGLPAATSAEAAEFTTVPAERPGLSTETPRLLEDTLNPAVRAAFARAPSAATDRADRQEAIRRAEAPA